MAAMARPSRPLRAGTERGRAIVHDLAREAETARLEHGTTYAELGRALGLGGSQVARVCRGRSPDLSIVRAAQLMAVLGLELSARAFPAGPAVRDRAQVALLERLRARISPALSWRTEVPVIELPESGRRDLRAWDAGIDGPGWSVRLDAETHIGDLQAVQRRVALKQRDGRVGCVILLLAETRHHAVLLRLAGDGLAAEFPVPARQALRALAAGRSPGGNALIRL
jgi:transcriptional regulator with XRE-family HTH domain